MAGSVPEDRTSAYRQVAVIPFKAHGQPQPFRRLPRFWFSALVWSATRKKLDSTLPVNCLPSHLAALPPYSCGEGVKLYVPFQ
jgi:hypothetical protein